MICMLTYPNIKDCRYLVGHIENETHIPTERLHNYPRSEIQGVFWFCRILYLDSGLERSIEVDRYRIQGRVYNYTYLVLIRNLL